MRASAELSPDGRVRRLRAAIDEAPGRFGIRARNRQVLQRAENALVRLDIAPTGRDQEKRSGRSMGR